MAAYAPRGLYFEDFELETEFTSSARTITESDIVSFAGLSGDYNQIHTDVEFSKSTPFGQRIAHGLLVTSIATGLVTQSGLLEGTIIAFREIDQWKFTKPVFIGDTIHVLIKVIEKKLYKRLGGGTIHIHVDVRNQNDETVMNGVWIALIASKPE